MRSIDPEPDEQEQLDELLNDVAVEMGYQPRGIGPRGEHPLSMGLTQAELAAEIGVHKISICRYETSVKKPIPIVVRALEALRQRRDKIRRHAGR